MWEVIRHGWSTSASKMWSMQKGEECSGTADGNLSLLLALK